jgi:hypothetical protein
VVNAPAWKAYDEATAEARKARNEATAEAWKATTCDELRAMFQCPEVV